MRKQSSARRPAPPAPASQRTPRAADAGEPGALDDVAALVIFARVIQQRSFTRAARALGTSTSAVSKRIARLEARLGASLLTRTTRHVVPTEAGLALYERCLRILREVEDAELLVADLQAAPRGLLRVTAPVYFGELHIAPLIATLALRHPGLRIELSLSDRFVDVSAEGFDLAVRIGPLSGATLNVRKLVRDPIIACAAPAYLQRRGTPERPQDLLEHDCLRYTLTTHKGRWRFHDEKGETVYVPVMGPLDSDHSGALREAARAGLGIVYLPQFYLAEALQRGELVRVLTRFAPSPIDIQAVYPSQQRLPAKTRACLDVLTEELPKRLALCATHDFGDHRPV
jgi:DNA-binding transcriptional LysR family regulator